LYGKTRNIHEWGNIMETSNEKIEIQISKGKSLLILFGAIGFVIAGIYFVLNPPHDYDPLFIRIIGIVAIVFFGFGIIVALRSLFNKKVGLVIDNNGIMDNCSGIPAGNIPWEKIIEIKDIKIKSQRIFLIIVKNPEEYIETQQNPFLRQMAEANYKIYETPISISANMLKCNFNELRNILQEQFKKYRNAT
jgi:hypothetical protein